MPFLFRLLISLARSYAHIIPVLQCKVNVFSHEGDVRGGVVRGKAARRNIRGDLLDFRKNINVKGLCKINPFQIGNASVFGVVGVCKILNFIIFVFKGIFE